MFSNELSLKVIATFFAIIALASCTDNQTIAGAAQTQNARSQSIVLDVYKNPNCGCCNKWNSHINEHGIQSNVHIYQNPSVIKDEKGIEPRYRSCHTAMSKDGYAFEGHIPAKFIQQFLDETHADDVIGLSVPGMPLGTPGMEVDDKFQPYRVLLLKSDRTSEIYASVHSYEEQF